MKQLFHILLIFVCFNTLHGMDPLSPVPYEASGEVRVKLPTSLKLRRTGQRTGQAPQTTILHLPKELIIKIARCCDPIQKNILREVCTYFGTTLKRSIISSSDKGEALVAYTEENNLEMMRFLLAKGTNVNNINVLGMTLFHIAMDNKNEDAMQLLIDYGADISIPKKKLYPLQQAVYQGNEKMVKTLLRLKADPNLLPYPLAIAFSQRYLTIAALLVDAGAHIDRVYGDNCTYICAATGIGDVDVVELLLKSGANVNHAKNDGWTPLCLAAYYSDIKMIKLLLDNGADIHYALTANSTIDSTIKKGDTPLVIAQRRGHTEIVELLQQRIREVDNHAVTKNPSQGKKKKQKPALFSR